MKLSPDETVFWEYGYIHINLTVVTTWALMAVMVISSGWITRNLKSDIRISRWQLILEIIVIMINNQIKEIGLEKPERYIAFIGTLFLFIGLANICMIFPFYQAPTGSLSTTAGLAICVFLSVPYYGIRKNGLLAYLQSYLKPTFIMLPFNLISEVSRTLALAVRLFGNIMSGGMIVAILLTIAPFIFPVVMSMLGLLTGIVQAYIFSVLATVYIAAAIRIKAIA
ncbi:F0F1 ATP synthase subunit A [Rhodonellum sp.]|uniref:F0F1 ATP synthase subunit A n=1 Tax=Rhodonellum sp. TaxID=2231180 RepID=UPI002718B724|nr:F0F1 ATP synthase subunit A [Rhodonellum sp.]MDO9551361.1 F0F1 ATP synthase subunit A [Rhodonellum sp.]